MQQMAGWNRPTSPFHAGEEAVQMRVGVADKMARRGAKVVRAEMPEQHRAFFAELPLIFVGHSDDEGWPHASVLIGTPGFISSPDAKTLSIKAKPLAGDPLTDALQPGRSLGFVGMGLSNRRRNRVNGRISTAGPKGFSVTVEQSFGNCPQYIQTRAPSFMAPITPPPAVALDTLDNEARRLIRAADSFHVASASGNIGAETGTDGVDMSHRGGRPGFVRVEGDVLTIPDFAGNLHYNTLGNFEVNPRAGLLFIDHATGDLLQISGTVEIIWDGEEVAHFRGAERLWRVTVRDALRLPARLPIRWGSPDFSPNTCITGTWDEAKALRAAEEKRSEWRPMRVTRVVPESDEIRSFYLTPNDGAALFDHSAGQYLTIKALPTGADKPLLRTYTLSSAPGDAEYRISVKRESPEGRVSQHLHDHITAGDVLEARAPLGDFVIDSAEPRPAVLLAGGVGITPMISMVRHVAREGLRTRKRRALTLFHSARTTSARAFHGELTELAQKSQDALRYISTISQPDDGETSFDAQGRINADLLRRHLPLDDYDFFLCGPGGFMQDMYDMLRGLGVADARIFAEAFGPAQLARSTDAGSDVPAAEPEADDAVVVFGASGFEQSWSKGDPPLLDVAEAHGLQPEFSCRGGTCGTCATRLISGDVAYRSPPSAPHEPDQVLICCAVPAEGATRIELDL